MKQIILWFSLISLSLGCKNDLKRYELIPMATNNSSSGIVVIDTYTGDVWGRLLGYSNESPDSTWTYLGNPSHIKK